LFLEKVRELLKQIIELIFNIIFNENIIIINTVTCYGGKPQEVLIMENELDALVTFLLFRLNRMCKILNFHYLIAESLDGGQTKSYARSSKCFECR